ncbi:calcium-binding protein [Roseomonas sp. AR75]|uniref:beta strand repeat-containing protein n=1 Tax=Roseomonas sp. AR75 TaxID=2562311 RepID=UPI0010C145FF|nr:calcium-binding protein [Roseomonas sp. AR75]
MAIIFGSPGADTITDLVNTAGGQLASGADDEIYGGPSGADNLFGAGGNDLLQSSFSANSTLDGGTGNDSLFGSDNGQYLFGGEGDDYLEGAAGADTIYGAAGADTINLYADIGGSSLGGMDSIGGFDAGEGDRLRFEAGFAGNTLPFYWYGGGLSAQVSLTAGLLLPGGATAGAILGYWVPKSGGDGWFVLDFDRDGVLDTTDFAAFVDTITNQALTIASFLPGEFAGAAGSIQGSDSADTMSGSPFNDSLYGMLGDDSLVGGAGNDFLADANAFPGDAGNDTLDGGEGNDNLQPGDGADSVNGGPGRDNVTYFGPGGTVIDLVAGLAIDNDGDADTLVGIENASGAEGADSILGNAEDNSFSGNAGNDTLDGGAGNDFLSPGTGWDVVEGGPGNDTLNYAFITGIDSIVANLETGLVVAQNGETDTVSGIERLLGTEGADSLQGDGLNNTLQGGSGNDTMGGGAGNDSLWAMAGDDSLAGEAGNDTLQADAGQDTLDGGDGNDSLFGLDDADSIVGGAGNDSLIGGAGADTLDGGAGDDFLRPGDGNDRVFGGAGFDTGSYNGDTGPITATIGSGTDGQNATVISALGADTLSGIDALDATSGNDRIEVASVDTNVGIQIRGLAGADTIIGPSTPSTSILADYLVGGVTQGINVDLISGVVSNDGFGSQDRLINITWVRGTNFNDVILGSDFNDRIRGRGGNDTLDGRGGTFDNLDYSNSPGPVVVDLATGIVSADGDGGADSVAGFELVRATSGGDSIRGSDVAETFEPYSGADTIHGGGGQDRVSYFSLSTGGTIVAPPVPIGIIADLVAGTVRDPWGTTDIVASIERITGTSLGDSILGGAENNRFNGRGGNDTFIGGAGSDYVEYSNATLGVEVDLTAGTAQDGEGGADTLVSIENVIGGSGADTLTGVEQRGRAASLLRGSAGDDLLIGIPGAFVVADYADQVAGMSIDLASGSVVDRFGDTDTLVDIHGANMFGNFADTITGTGEGDWISPSEGADSVDAGGGFDIVAYGATDMSGVLVNLATQRATDAGGGADTILGFEGVSLGFGDDTVFGDAGDNMIGPGAGADSVDGGTGQDTVSYVLGFAPDAQQYTINAAGDRAPLQGVLLDLQAGTAIDFAGDNDTLVSIEHAIGSAVGDTLRGSGIGNSLSGAEGNDVLEGREGDDTLAGQWGNDSLDGGAGNDTAVFDGDAADFAITDLGGGLFTVVDLRAGQPEGADTVSGVEFLEFADTVLAATSTVPTEGDNVLEGSGVADTIDALGGNDDVRGLAGADRLLGGDGNDTLDGGSENDTLAGGSGDDSLIGGPGADSLVGAAGNDSYVVDDAADKTLEARDAGIDTVFATLTWTLGAHLDNLVLLGDASINGTGNNLNNVITGNGAANTLIGAGRADTLIGGGGNDLYLPDATDTLIEEENGGYDVVILNATFALSEHIEELRFNGTANARGDGNAANNLIVGNAGGNRLLGYDGNDTLSGGQGNDTLQGGEGADSLVGGEGVDRLDGGNGDDTYLIGDLDQIIELVGAGIDTVLSSISYTLTPTLENLTLLASTDLAATGNALANVLTGNGGANLLRGLGEADRISGGQGADTIEGGVGADTLTGGGGFDRFLWLTPNEGGDAVTDFRPGDDLLAFASAGFGGLPVGALDASRFANNAPGAALGQFVYTKASGVLAWDADGTGAGAAVTIATLTTKPTLAATDFVIA